MDDLNRTEFLNWLKAVLALGHLKDGIVGPVVDAMKKFYTKMPKTCDKCENEVSACSCSPPRICIKNYLAANHQRKLAGIKWEKVKNNIWTCYWDVASCYSSEGNTTSTGPESTDCAGILTIIINAKNVRTALGIKEKIDGQDTLSQARNTRNKVIHAGEYKLSSQEKDNVFEKMIDVVDLSNEFDQKTIQILKKLQETQLVISEIPTALIMNEVVSGMQEKVEEEVRRQFNEGVEQLMTGMAECISPDEDREKALMNIQNVGTVKFGDFFKAATQAGVQDYFRKFQPTDKPSLYKSVNRHDAQCDGAIAIRGCTYLHDGRLVLADYTRSRLLVFDIEYNYIRHHDIKYQPYTICTGDEEHVVHVLCYYPHYCIVSFSMVGGQCEEQNMLNVDSSAECIAVTGDTFIVGYTGGIVMYNKHGKQINSISTDVLVLAVCMSPDITMFYHSGYKKVVCHKGDSGEEVSKYSVHSLGYIYGMCCDRDGYVYCVDYNNHNVHRISPDCTTGRVGLDSVMGIDRPFTMCYHHSKDMFVVSNYNTLDARSKEVMFNVYKM